MALRKNSQSNCFQSSPISSQIDPHSLNLVAEFRRWPSIRGFLARNFLAQAFERKASNFKKDRLTFPWRKQRRYASTYIVQRWWFTKFWTHSKYILVQLVFDYTSEKWKTYLGNCKYRDNLIRERVYGLYSIELNIRIWCRGNAYRSHLSLNTSIAWTKFLF